MPSTKELRRRIKSIKSTRQITKAMELVAAAKMRKAQQQAAASRTYASLAWELINNLAQTTDPRLHRLLDQRPEVKKIGLIVVSSNRGLAGSFNAQIFAAVNKYMQTVHPHLAFPLKGEEREERNLLAGEEQKNIPSPRGGGEGRGGLPEIELITMGKKVRDSLRKRGGNIVADFEKIDFNLREQDIVPLALLAIQDFISGKYDRVAIAYMQFMTTLNQKPVVKEILPLTSPSTLSSHSLPTEYLFEPTADLVLESVLPRLIRMQIYQAVQETNASEHSARMVAMKNATDAAGDLISDLTLEFNKLRQASITKEISEIVAGKLSLR